MLTLFSIPKPFSGPIAELQRTAIRSWTLLDPDIQVVLLGDEEGVAEAARTAGTEHVAALERNERGTPRLDDAFARADRVARHPLRCFVNADVVLLDDLRAAVARVATLADRFLLVGRTTELPAVDPAELEHRLRLRVRAQAEGAPRGAAALDYFVFPAGLFGELPPFLVGRACFDNWLVWRARREGPVVDASRAVVAIHQSHGYGHLAAGKDEAYYGAEADWNRRLAGGNERIYTIHDASHRLTASGEVRRNAGAVLRVRERARKVAWKLGRR